MKILAFSDIHGSRKQAAELVEASRGADLVIGAGDYCNMGKGLGEALGLLGGIRAPMVLVPGNAESAEALRGEVEEGIAVLHGGGTTIGGVRIFGLGYSVPPPPFGEGWSQNLEEDEAERILADCESADILISHSPPRGAADRLANGQSVGSLAVAAAIERIQPGLVLCGHIHDSWGQEGRIGTARVVNLGPFANWFEI